MAGARRVTRRLLPLLTLAALGWFARHVDWRQTMAVVGTASPGYVALATVAEFVSVAARGARWWLFLRPLAPVPLSLPVRATFAGAGLNNLLVANGGDAARVVLVTRALRIPSAPVVATFVLDRVWDAIGYAVMFAGTALVAPLPPALERHRRGAFVALGLAAVAVAALAIHARRAATTAPFIDSASAESGAVPDGAGYLRRVARALAQLSDARRSAAALALTMVGWAFQVATYAFGAAAAHAPLPAAGNVATVLTVNLGFVVRATPGGVGVFQALYALAARSFGVPGSAAVASAIVIQAVQIIPITVVGLALAPQLVFHRGRGEAD